MGNKNLGIKFISFLTIGELNYFLTSENIVVEFLDVKSSQSFEFLDFNTLTPFQTQKLKTLKIYTTIHEFFLNQPKRNYSTK